MKIVFMCPHTNVSGGPKVILTVAKGLRRMGIDSSVAVYRFSDKSMHWLSGGTDTLPIVETKNPAHPLLTGASCIINFADGITFPELLDKKQVLFLQGFGTQNLAVETANIRFKYNAVIATSAWLVDTAQVYGHKDVTLIHPGIDAVFALQKREPIHTSTSVIIGGLAHPSPEKNFNRYIAAVCSLKRNYNINVLAHILSVQPLPQIKEFNDLAIPYTVFVSPMPREIATMYAQCSVWISTSISEGWGLTTLESLACGTPVVFIPNRGLNNYMIHEQNCLVVKDATDSVAQGVTQLLHDTSLRSKVVEGGLTLTKRFTWGHTLSLFAQVLARITGK